LRAVGPLTAPEYGWVSRHNNQSKKPAVLQPARTNSQLLVGFAASEFGRKTNHTRLLRSASPFWSVDCPRNLTGQDIQMISKPRE